MRAAPIGAGECRFLWRQRSRLGPLLVLQRAIESMGPRRQSPQGSRPVQPAMPGPDASDPDGARIEFRKRDYRY